MSIYGVFFWAVSSCIQSEDRKIRTRKNYVPGNFSSGVALAEITSSSQKTRHYIKRLIRFLSMLLLLLEIGVRSSFLTTMIAIKTLMS